MKHPSHTDLASVLHTDLTRRESLQWLGLGTGALIVPAWIPSLATADSSICTLTPELTVGPYYVDKEKVRSNITEGKAGIPLQLRVTVLDSAKCTPVKDAAVDLWHCDARGYYSGYTANNPDSDMFSGQSGGPQGGPPGDGMGPGGQGGPGPGGMGGMGAGGSPGDRPEGGGPPEGPDPNSGSMFQPTDTKTFFRGIQFTNAKGVAEFTTIYPGWYFGRAIHIHMKVHVGSTEKDQLLAGGHVSHIGQLAFPDEISDRLAKVAAYADRKLARTRNNEDSVFGSDTISECMVKLTPRSKDITMGFIADATITVNSATTPKAAPFAGGGARTG